jgi:small subunit ribosomal protein S24e
MKIEITNKKENPLQDRIEIRFEIDHVGETTPGRNVVAEEIAKKEKTKRDLVIVDSVESVYGIGKSKGYAKVYKNKKSILEYEPAYKLARNGIVDENAYKPPEKKE